jgi:hypothetical protein
LTNRIVLNLKTLAQKQQKIKSVKRQLTELEKIFACHSSDRGLIFRIYKELKKLNAKIKIIQSIASQMQKYKWSINT